MKLELRRFIILSVIVALSLIIVTYLFSLFHVIKVSVTPVFYLVPFIMLVTLAVHSFLLYSVKGGDRVFISKYIAASGLKLIIYLVALLLYVFSVGKDIKFVMVIFLITYLIYSVVEVSSILKYLKK